MYIGLDLGTSGLKGLLIDERQRVVGSANAALQVSRPQPAWSEQTPADWVAAATAVLQALRGDHPARFAAVKGIGLSGQQHGATLLGADDAVLRPCILWNDTRAHREADEMNAGGLFGEVTGNVIFAGFTAPKLVWVRRHEPQVFGQVRKILLPKDYLRFWLTGDYVSEMSDASGMGWLDIARRRWDERLLAATGLTLDHLPRLVEGSQPSATLRPALAAELGLNDGVTVAGGAGDNAAAACAMGAVRENVAFASIGTSGVLFAANAEFRPNTASAVHSFCHAVPDTWHQMGVILSATDSLNWLARVVSRDAVQLIGALGAELRAPTGVSFLPYLGGERTPHNDPLARGGFSGLGHASDVEALTQAVLEGVAFAFKDSLLALAEAGTEVRRVWAVGGGSKSNYWLRVLATALGVPVEVPADGDFGAAFGAARLGMLAAENADPLSVCTPPAVAASIEPVAELSTAFGAAYRRYRALYPALKTVV